MPGLPETGSHYHAGFPDEGKPTVKFTVQAGKRECCLVVLLVRADAPIDRIEAVRALLRKHGAATFETLDPATAGGCGGDSDHRAPWDATRAAPPVRVVRTSFALAEVEAVKKELSGIPGLGEAGLWRLGVEDAAGRIAVDVALVEGK